ncbi:MAG: 5,10-methylenetetrahydrofolate reductase [Acidobacteria bacterium]|nr:5,10-methylenetetrahydrofolate reductase [Acidobacteriota bacterium]
MTSVATSPVRIDQLLAAGHTRSFEFFPPKSDEESATLSATLSDLETLEPSFVSVTYRGGHESRQRTFDLVTHIQRGRLISMAHLICVGHRRAEMRQILENYLACDVVNVMALGGDIPEDPDLVASEFRYALDLVELARDVGEFSIGVAAHPLGHPRSPDRRSDRRHLAEKLRLADFAITQFFFELADWTTLVQELGELDVTKPVLPGIMPVTTLAGVSRMAQMGAAVPAQLVARLETAHAAGGPAAVRAEGVRAASELCEQLLGAGAPGLHFYTLNRSTATREIHESLFGPHGVRRP